MSRGKPLTGRQWAKLGAVPMLGNDRAPDGWIEVQRDDDHDHRASDVDAACAVARESGVRIACLYNDVTGALLPLDTRAGEEGCSLAIDDAREALERVAGNDDWIVIVPAYCLA